MMKIMTIFAAVLLLNHSAFSADIPTAGGQIKQIPPAPVTQQAVPDIRIDREKVIPLPASSDVKIRVKRLQLSGQTLYSEVDLLALTDFRPESELSLAELRVMAARIADHYHRNGYFAATVYLPAQDVLNGVVTIVVTEGRYGTITVLNDSGIADSLIQSLIGGLISGDIIAAAPLDRRLLLLSDVPGLVVTSSLTPGASAGTSDLTFVITAGKRVVGSVDVDNAGNRYTGRYRVGGTVSLNEPAGFGDVATLRALTSGNGLNFFRASYQIQDGKAKVGAAYSILGYQLGEEFKPLEAKGTAQIMSVYGSYPLLRSRNSNLHLQIAYDDKTFQDRMNSVALVTDKAAHVLMLTLHGDNHDTFAGGGQNGYSLTWTAGSIDVRSPAAYLYDAATSQSAGSYTKYSYSLMRLQRVTDSVSLYAAVNGQFALKNLDVSEKMELGGMYAVRAYPEGEAYADQGYILNLEARLLLPKLSEHQPGQIRLIGLVDTGSVIINKNQWAVGSNSRTLSGAGIGLTWEEYSSFSLKMYYARKLGKEPATSAPDSPGQFWIQIVKFF